MADHLHPRERALRELPLAYSLALRLRDAGVAPEVVCEYVGIEKSSLAGLYRIAEAKLATALAADPGPRRAQPDIHVARSRNQSKST